MKETHRMLNKLCNEIELLLESKCLSDLFFLRKKSDILCTLLSMSYINCYLTPEQKSSCWKVYSKAEAFLASQQFQDKMAII